MRRDFARWIEAYGQKESRLIFLTGDLGFDALEGVEKALQRRFVNMGVAEQNMVSVAAGLAHQGLLPLCYSIAPFAVFRPYEQIRLDVALHRLNVKIVGNGGGYGYGIMGASHHALEDLAVLSSLPNFSCFVPLCNSDVDSACAALFRYEGPSYLRLGFGVWPSDMDPLPDFQPIRKLAGHRSSKPTVTVAGLGPVLLNALPWIVENGDVDVFAVSQLPLQEVTDELLESVASSELLWVIEEHTARGGTGEHLTAQLARRGARFRLQHSCALGYPDNLIGSQGYHQRRSHLDPASLQATFLSLQQEKQSCRTL